MAAVDADADPLAAAGRIDQHRQLVEVAAERSLGAGGVLEQDRAALGLGEDLADHLARARDASSSGSFLREPAWRTTPSAPIASPSRTACSERGQRLLADLLVGGRRVDQVDGVDHHRSERRGGERLVEGGEVVRPVVASAARRAGSGGRSGSRRSRARRRARRRWAARPAVETCAPISTWTEPLRVRFAPSPTGALHIGGARTALYNWLVGPGIGRDDWSCGSRTPTASAPPRRTSSRSSTR